MIKPIHITPNTYPVKYSIFLGYNNKDKQLIYHNIVGVSNYTKKHISKEIADTDLHSEHAWCFTCSTYIVIILPIWKHDPEYYALLQHELLHAVIYSGTKCGFKLSEDSEEYYTYMVQYLTQQAYKKLWQ